MTTIDAETGRGRLAGSPSEIPWEGWKDILWRVYVEFTGDRITLIAAGATFYLLLALFPALTAFVSLYGFVADPVTIADHIAFLGSVLPSGGVELIQSQLEALASQNTAALSFAFLLGLGFALWSANNGIKTLFEALNVAYDETEQRSFVALNLLSLLFTLAALAIGIAFIFTVGVVPAILALVGLSGSEELLISLMRWPLLFVVSAAGVSILYRYGPSRERARWRWITWGGVFASVLWLVASVLFSWYLANFADYNATYGSLGAVIGFMMWTWISVVILLLGAELNAEMEHQTARDSTTGAARPMGMRGATMADTLGASRNSRRAQTEAERKAAAPPRFDGADDGPSATPPRRRPRRERLSEAIVRFGVPAAAVGAVVAMELFDRRRADPSPTPPIAPTRTERLKQTSRQASVLANSLKAWPRALLEDPEIRARVLSIARTVGEMAAARSVRSAPKRKRRWWG